MKEITRNSSHGDSRLICPRCARAPVASGVVAALLLASPWLRADQLEMLNGDRYVGKVLSLNTNTVVWQSDVLGTVKLPRNKVLTINLGSGAATNLARLPGSAPPVGGSDGAAGKAHPSANPSLQRSGAPPPQAPDLRQLGGDTNLIAQIQAQFLNGAGPEANAKFNELLGGLTSGKLGVNDIRAEAKSAADQLRAAKRDLGDDAGWALDAYLSVLDHFLRETAPAGGSGTNAPAQAPKPKPAPAAEEE